MAVDTDSILAISTASGVFLCFITLVMTSLISSCNCVTCRRNCARKCKRDCDRDCNCKRERSETDEDLVTTSTSTLSAA